MHFRLFDRPLITDGELNNMTVTGVYDDYEPAEAYEGRVQINGSVGLCRVEILENNLPPGAYAYVDNVFKQVVIKWPRYVPPSNNYTGIENGDFEQGDTGSWSRVGGEHPFVIEPDDDGNMSLKFKEGFSGGDFVESPLAPITDINRQITLTGQIAQGKSSKGKMWGGVVLAFHDEARNLLNWVEGSWVNSGGGYQQSKAVGAAANPRAKFVSARIHFQRKGQNYPAWADNIQWDHAWSVGHDSDDQLKVRVKVTDSLNNVAYHTGTIDEYSIWRTSKLYTVTALDEFRLDRPQLEGMLRGGVPSQIEPMSLGRVAFHSITRKGLVIRHDEMDYFALGRSSMLSMSRRTMVKRADGEDYTTRGRPLMNSMGRKTHPSIRNNLDVMARKRPTFTSVTRTPI